MNSDASSATLYVMQYNGSGDLFSGRNSSNNEVINLGVDGSATFAGNVQATKPRSSTAGNSTGGLCINPSDTTHYYNFRVDSVDNQLRIDTVDGVDKIKFGANGSITAAGDISHITFDSSSNAATAKGITAYNSGQLIVQGSSGVTSGDQTTFATYYGNIETFGVKNDGSATFAGHVKSTNGSGSAFLGASSGSGLAINNSSNATVVELNYDGSATFTGAVTAQSYVTSSDQRFKENITDANSQLADVTALGNKLRNWDWTADAPVADKDTRFLGLVAQEAETICPGIVKTIARTKQGAELTPETTDEEGNVTPATYEELDDSYKGISHDALIMKLLGAVAELSAEVAALKGA